jgi:hypothetical protein
MRTLEGDRVGSDIPSAWCSMSVTTDTDLVPDDWTSCSASDVINLERLSCGRDPEGL